MKYHLHTDEPPDKERGSRPSVCTFETTQMDAPPETFSLEGGRTPSIHIVDANDRKAVKFALSPGGRKRLRKMRNQSLKKSVSLPMDRARERECD